MLQDEAKIAAKINEYKLRLDHYTYGDNVIHDLLHIVSVITSICTDLEVECPVVVGGLAVEIYTAGGYVTQDADLITDSMTDTHRLMLGLGFTTKAGYRYYCHPKFGDVIEFPTPPLNGSKQRILTITLPNGGDICVIGLEDIVINRLEEFVHWDNRNMASESAVQIVSILKAHIEKMDLDYLADRASKKGVGDAFEQLSQMAKKML